jgi:hypothetical protein
MGVLAFKETPMFRFFAVTFAFILFVIWNVAQGFINVGNNVFGLLPF